MIERLRMAFDHSVFPPSCVLLDVCHLLVLEIIQEVVLVTFFHLFLDLIETRHGRFALEHRQAERHDRHRLLVHVERQTGLVRGDEVVLHERAERRAQMGEGGDVVHRPDESLHTAVPTAAPAGPEHGRHALVAQASGHDLVPELTELDRGDQIVLEQVVGGQEQLHLRPDRRRDRDDPDLARLALPFTVDQEIQQDPLGVRHTYTSWFDIASFALLPRDALPFLFLGGNEFIILISSFTPTTKLTYNCT